MIVEFGWTPQNASATLERVAKDGEVLYSCTMVTVKIHQLPVSFRCGLPGFGPYGCAFELVRFPIQ